MYIFDAQIRAKALAMKRKLQNISIPQTILALTFSLFCLSIDISASIAQPLTKNAHTALYYEPIQSNFQDPVKGLASLVSEALKEKQAGNTDQSKKLSSEAISTAGSLLHSLPRGHAPTLWYLLGYSYELQEDYSQALKAYSSSLETRANNALVIARKAWVYLAQNKHKQAIAALREVLWRSTEGSEHVYELITKSQLALGEDELALESIEKSLTINPKHLPTLKMLVKVRQKQIELATEPPVKLELTNQLFAELGAVVAQDRTDKTFTIAYAKMLLERSDPLVHSEQFELVKNLASSVAEKSKYEDEDAVRLLFETLLKQKKLDDAEVVIKKALTKKPSSTSLQDALKQLEIERGLEL